MLAYFGLSTSAFREHWKLALVLVLTPLVLSAIITAASGVRGVAGWLVGVVCLVALNVAWSLVLNHSATWRRACDRLSNQPRRPSSVR
ncbi:MAG TPA: hypothetical protein VGF68_01160 [Solirubrobacteraceae bacterium]